MKLDLNYKNIITTQGLSFPDGCFPDGLTELHLVGNMLTSLPSLPPTLTHLYCWSNRLTSLPPLPLTLRVLSCSHNQLTSLPSLPPSLTSLHCSYNQLTSLPPLPPSLTGLYCRNNRLTSLPSLPKSLAVLYCDDNPFPTHYHENGKLKSNEELIIIIKVDRLMKARAILSRLIIDRLARNIQRCWKRYWLEPYHDPQLGYPVSRYLLHYQHEL